MSKLTHLDEKGQARMVDVTGKDTTERTATAEAFVHMKPETLALILSGEAPKGDVLSVARVAGIMAAKKTSELIPLCHPLAITGAKVECEPEETAGGVRVTATVKVSGQTGVEMEALTAASIAALTIYDMLKASDKGMVISDVRLLSKEGGKSGAFRADDKKARNSSPAPARRASMAAAVSTHRKVKPRELMNEVAMRVQPMDHNARREAFRRFMTSRGLTAHAWARDAGLQVGAIYSFLHGRTHSLAKADEEKLAKAARVDVDDIYRA